MRYLSSNKISSDLEYRIHCFNKPLIIRRKCEYRVKKLKTDKEFFCRYIHVYLYMYIIYMYMYNASRHKFQYLVPIHCTYTVQYKCKAPTCTYTCTCVSFRHLLIIHILQMQSTNICICTCTCTSFRHLLIIHILQMQSTNMYMFKIVSLLICVILCIVKLLLLWNNDKFIFCSCVL